MINKNRLESLCNIYAVSSDEKECKELIKNEMMNLVDEFKEDRLGSIFGVKKSKNQNAKVLMIAAPIDEYGYMVKEITKEGTIKLLALEDLAPVSYLHQEATIKTRNDQFIKGIISCKQHRFAEEKVNSINEDSLVLDCGLSIEEIKSQVTIGDLVAIDGSYKMLGRDTIVSKSLNQRCLVEVGLSLLESLKDEELDYDLVVGAIAQSTVGYRGTMTATYVVQPDAAIALTGFDTAKSSPVIALQDGVMVAIADRQMLPSQKLINDFTKHCDAKKCTSILASDGSFIHKTGKGTPCMSIGIAMNNIGTCQVMASYMDMNRLVDTLKDYCLTMTSSKIEEIGFGVSYD